MIISSVESTAIVILEWQLLQGAAESTIFSGIAFFSVTRTAEADLSLPSKQILYHQHLR